MSAAHEESRFAVTWVVLALLVPVIGCTGEPAVEVVSGPAVEVASESAADPAADSSEPRISRRAHRIREARAWSFSARPPPTGSCCSRRWFRTRPT